MTMMMVMLMPIYDDEADAGGGGEDNAEADDAGSDDLWLVLVMDVGWCFPDDDDNGMMRNPFWLIAQRRGANVKDAELRMPTWGRLIEDDAVMTATCAQRLEANSLRPLSEANE